MATLSRPRIIITAAATLGLLALVASPAMAVKIPERQYVPAGLSTVVHLRVDAGCNGAPTDGLEVSVPEDLSSVTPEAAPGWTVEIETVPALSATEDGSTERISVVRWVGGSLPDGQFMDFGLRAQFPEEADTVLTFPVIQTCGTETLEWTDAEGPYRAPSVRVGQPVTAQEIATMVGSVEDLLADVERLQEQTGAVNVHVLRDRVEELEASRERIVQALTNLRQRLEAVEAVLPTEPASDSQ